ncbi:DUF423 domain-containing protein [Paenibacillus aceti]|uniref:Membrane protein n=1 Tax=Paenibacillus aceti TaxID=1820010 RepID=A0ABQ1VNN2_9BACL|nr:DUF423 domain-containing protein [Paenibacillus aceti]GGF84739.1 membrane protein [Paenibacillus aceti]
MQRKYAGIGAILMLLSVALGAFGAHVLKAEIGEAALGTFETGVHYQMIHGLGMILASVAAAFGGNAGRWRWANILFLIGTILFSGSLYLLAITGWRWFGPITPLGGVSFLAGWLMFILAAWDKKQQ